MVSAQNNLAIAHPVATTAPHVTAIAHKGKVSVHPVNLTTVARAMVAHVHHVTLIHHVHLATTMMTSNRGPTRTWALKVVSTPLATKRKAVVVVNQIPHAPALTS
jgi:hypothetical protein